MKNWDGLSQHKKLKLRLQAVKDPMFFWESPYFCNLELWDKQKEILGEFYRIDKDGVRVYNELIIQAGMRSSKTFMAGCIGSYELFKLLQYGNPDQGMTPGDYYGLAPGSSIFIINVAAKEEQAQDTIYAQMKARITTNSYFTNEVPGFNKERDIYKLRMNFEAYNIFIIAAGCNSQSIVGRTAKVVLFDELNKFKTEGEVEGGEKMYDLLSKSTMTFHTSHRNIDRGKILNENIRVVVSSPMHEGDVVHQKIMEAPKISNRLAYKLATWDINPSETEEKLMDEFHRSPETFWRDYGGEAIGTMEDYFKKKEVVRSILNEKKENWSIKLASCNDDGIMKDGYIVDLPNDLPRGRYVLAGDPSLKNDAFGISLLRQTFDEKGPFYHYDMLLRLMPAAHITKISDLQKVSGEIDPFKIKTLFVYLCNNLPIEAVLFDTWNFPSVTQAIGDIGVEVIQNTVDKEAYDVFKDLVYRRRVECPNFPFVVNEELNKLVLKNGKRVDHTAASTKDVADAMVNCAYYLTGEYDERRKRPKKGYVNPFPGWNGIYGV